MPGMAATWDKMSVQYRKDDKGKNNDKETFDNKRRIYVYMVKQMV